MLNTYINDNMLVPYPFKTGTLLPFPNSIFVGAGISVNGLAEGDSVYISGIEITQDSITVSIYARVHAVIDGSEKDIPIAHATAGQRGYGSLVSECPELNIAGYIAVGAINKEHTGTYAGPFYLDSSCVTYVSDQQCGGINTITTNGAKMNAPYQLNLGADGWLSLDGSLAPGDTVAIKATIPSAAITDISRQRYTYNMVNSINGVTIPSGEAVKALELKSADTRKIKISVDTANDNIVIVSVDGTKEFPNCYAADDDAPGAT